MIHEYLQVCAHEYSILNNPTHTLHHEATTDRIRLCGLIFPPVDRHVDREGVRLWT